MLNISGNISIDEREISEEFIRASGPGGQNVNKVATAVKLRFDVLHSPSLPPDVRERALHLGGSRITGEGVLVIDARQFRTQGQNRKDARDRLTAFLRSAAERPGVRKKTRPSAASKRRRLESKRRQKQKKRLRRPVLASTDT